MSSNRPARTGLRRLRAKIAIFSVLSLGAAAVPLALATPAQASYACTVTPLTPIYSHHNSSGVKVLDYRIQATCYKNRYLNIEQQRYENDYPWSFPFDGNDHLGTSHWNNYFLWAGQTQIIHNYRTLVDTEIGYEEVFQKTRYQEGYDGLWSSWTGYRATSDLSISN